MIKLPPRETWFHYVLGLTALFVASVAAFFSIMGIGMLFSGAAISSMIMASSLELGKIVATSFLYRYWGKTTKFLKIYLTAAILVLVLITSLGVFGWLSSAYQGSAMRYEMVQQQVSSLVEQKNSVIAQSELSKKRVDALIKIRNDQENRMNDALNSPVLSRNPTALRQVQEQNISLIKQTDEDIRTERTAYNGFIKDTIDTDKKIFEIKSDSSKTKDILTFKFVADAFGWDLNSTVKWFIVVIIIVFDPLAVSLILSYNVALFVDKKTSIVVVQEPTPEPTVPPVPTPTPESSPTPSETPVPTPTPTELVRVLLNEVPVEVTEKSNMITSGLRHSDLLHSPQPEPHRK